ncbi:hypothetical protein FBY13_101321 [Pantoea sp. SJZ147]|nr:hypothetical protein FBY13_101321 [Pantoea sp. SJZ147]
MNTCFILDQKVRFKQRASTKRTLYESIPLSALPSTSISTWQVPSFHHGKIADADGAQTSPDLSAALIFFTQFFGGTFGPGTDRLTHLGIV